MRNLEARYQQAKTMFQRKKRAEDLVILMLRLARVQHDSKRDVDAESTLRKLLAASFFQNA